MKGEAQAFRSTLRVNNDPSICPSSLYDLTCEISIMVGRIKTKLRQVRFDANTAQPTLTPVCPLCGREIPLAQRDAHHLTPKSHGGKATETLHRICHRQIHALFTEAELARNLNTMEALRTQRELMAFIRWVRTKPNDFFEKTRKSQRLKSM
jgi:hypothetical protein